MLDEFQNQILYLKYFIITEDRLQNNSEHDKIPLKIAILKQKIADKFGQNSLMYSKFIELKTIFSIINKEYKNAISLCKENIQRKKIILGRNHLQISKQYHILSVIFFRMLNFQQSHKYMVITEQIAKKNNHQKYLKFIQTQKIILDTLIKAKGQTLMSLKQNSFSIIPKNQNGSLNEFNKYLLGGNQRNSIFQDLKLQPNQNIQNLATDRMFKNVLSQMQGQNSIIVKAMSNQIIYNLKKKLFCRVHEFEIGQKIIYVCSVCDYLICEKCFKDQKQLHRHNLIKVKTSDCLLLRQFQIFSKYPYDVALNQLKHTQIKINNQQYIICEMPNILFSFLKRKISNNLNLADKDDYIYISNKRQDLRQYFSSKKTLIEQRNLLSSCVNLNFWDEGQEQTQFQTIQSNLLMKDQTLAIIDYIFYQESIHAQSNQSINQEQLEKKVNYYKNQKDIKNILRQKEEMFIITKNTLIINLINLITNIRFPLKLIYNSIKQTYLNALNQNFTYQQIYNKSFQIQGYFQASKNRVQNFTYQNTFVRIISFLELNSNQHSQDLSINTKLKIYKKESIQGICSDSGYIILQTIQKQLKLVPSKVIFNPGSIFKIIKSYKQTINLKQINFIQMEYVQFSIQNIHQIKDKENTFENEEKQLLQIYQCKSMFYQQNPNYLSVFCKNQQQWQSFMLFYMKLDQMSTNYKNYTNYNLSLLFFQYAKALSKNYKGIRNTNQKLLLLKGLSNIKLENQENFRLKNKIVVYLGSMFLHQNKLPIFDLDPQNFNLKYNIEDLIDNLQLNQNLKFTYILKRFTTEKTINQIQQRQIQSLLKSTFITILNKIKNQRNNLVNISSSFDEYFIQDQLKKVPQFAQDYRAYTYLTELVHRHLFCMNWEQSNLYTGKQLNQFLDYLLQFKNQNIKIKSIQDAQNYWLVYRALIYLYLKLQQPDKAQTICKQAQKNLQQFYGQNDLLTATINQLYIQFYLHTKDKVKALEIWESVKQVICQKYYKINYYQLAKTYIQFGIISTFNQNYQKSIQCIQYAFDFFKDYNFYFTKQFIKLSYKCRQLAYLKAQDQEQSLKYNINEELLQKIIEVKKNQQTIIKARQAIIFRGYQFNTKCHFQNINLETINQNLMIRRIKLQSMNQSHGQ